MIPYGLDLLSLILSTNWCIFYFDNYIIKLHFIVNDLTHNALQLYSDSGEAWNSLLFII